MKRHTMPVLALSLLLAGCGSGQFANPFTTTLTLTATPATVTASMDAPGRSTITATDSSSGKNVTGLHLTATSVPTGLNVDLAGGSVTVTPSNGTPDGTYPVTISADVPGGKGDVVLNVTVKNPAVPSYQVFTTPDAPTTNPGVSLHVAVTFTTDAGFTAPVKVVRVDGSVPDIAVTLDSTGVTFSPSAKTALGVYGFVLVTSDGQTERRTTLNVNITAATATK
jgi:hypothetical protein